MSFAKGGLKRNNYASCDWLECWLRLYFYHQDLKRKKDPMMAANKAAAGTATSGMFATLISADMCTGELAENPGS
jgi:hypothetical protein